MVTTFTYKHSLVRINARNFELSIIVVTDPQTYTETGAITIHCGAALPVRNVMNHNTHLITIFQENPWLAVKAVFKRTCASTRYNGLDGHPTHQSSFGEDGRDVQISTIANIPTLS